MAWSSGQWTNEPEGAVEAGTALEVTAREGSDAWRVTSYGFVHDTEHALLADFPDGSAMEVEFVADFSAQFDQAGIFIRVSSERWVKAGIEYSDGEAQLGAVVTDGMSDWSLAPVPDWAGGPVTVRASRSGDAVTVRARRGDGPMRLVRVLPFPVGVAAQAGPLVCAPTRSGLTVRVTRWSRGDADGALHD
ncbi:DUF1349 domain-containing protein [Microbacterium sp. W1N]|nr:DUF1349 domain-containing protein [Microbacterium festucae]MCT9819867.1 DUF1349 domain-containing protein [Microbacterium festucae]